MINETTYEMSDAGKEAYAKRVPPKARQIIDAIETIAQTYVLEYTGPGGEEDAGLSAIIELVKRLRMEL